MKKTGGDFDKGHSDVQSKMRQGCGKRTCLDCRHMCDFGSGRMCSRFNDGGDEMFIEIIDDSACPMFEGLESRCIKR